jgi:hypothetical protein
MMRAQSTFTVGIGQGWQVMAQLPFDAKVLTIDYSTLDGAPYTPPYGNIHHRNETLTGLGDGRAEIQQFTRINKALVVGAGFGLTVPLGKIEDDPYALTSKGIAHQHMQMGSGTTSPVFSATAVWMADRWGMVVSSNGLLTMTANAKGYRPSSRIQAGAGPSYRLNPKLMMTTSLSLSRDSQAEWHGKPDPMSGQTAFMGSVSMIQRFTPMLAAMVQARTTLAQWSDETLIKQRFIGSIGLTWTPAGKSD